MLFNPKKIRNGRGRGCGAARKVLRRTLPLPNASFIIRGVFSVQRGSSSVVERDLAKVDVAGSTPVSRSSFSRSTLPKQMDFFAVES
jgi:hypothetical protein